MIFQQTNRRGNKDVYGRDHALLIARMIHQIRERTTGPDGMSFIQQYYVTKGLKTNRVRGCGHGTGKRLDKTVKRPRGCKEIATCLVYVRRGGDFYSRMQQNWWAAGRGSQTSDLEVSCTGGIVEKVRMSVRSVSKLSRSITDASRDVSGMRYL